MNSPGSSMLSHMKQMDAIKEKPASFEMNGARHDSTGLRKPHSDAEMGKDFLFPVIASITTTVGAER